MKILSSGDKGKGQVITIDFVILSFVLMVILLAFMYAWNFLGIRWNNITEYNKQYAAALFAADLLVISPGNPPGWENLGTINSSTLVSLGLANERNVVNIQKLNKLANLSAQNYSFFKQRLGALNYEVFINITNANKTVSYAMLGVPPGQFNETVVLERFVMFNGSISTLRIEVWK